MSEHRPGCACPTCRPPRYDDVFFQGVAWLDSLVDDMPLVRDGRGNPLSVGDRVESVTRVADAARSAIRPERTGLVIDVFASTIPSRGLIKVELDDEALSEIVSLATLWIRLEEN